MADTQAPLLRRSAPEAPGAASRTSGVRAHRFFFFRKTSILKFKGLGWQSREEEEEEEEESVLSVS